MLNDEIPLDAATHIGEKKVMSPKMFMEGDTWQGGPRITPDSSPVKSRGDDMPREFAAVEDVELDLADIDEPPVSPLHNMQSGSGIIRAGIEKAVN
jgi:hypothetical protein